MKKGYFSYFPVSTFGSVMGLTGLAIAWHISSDLYNWSLIFSNIISIIAILTFIILLIVYGMKIITNFESFKAEFINPASRPFFGTIIISILLLPIIIHSYFPTFAIVMWWIGLFSMFAFALHIVSFWLISSQNIKLVNPGWIIPVVGTLDIPLATPFFGMNNTYYYISILALAIGLFFTIQIVNFIFHRIVFTEKLPEKLNPTLLILMVPFPVGFSAYEVVNPQIDLFSFSLFGIGFFFLIALVRHYANLLLFSCPFKLTWWAISFPLAALAIASLKIAQGTNLIFFEILSKVTLISFTAIIAWIGFLTIYKIFKGEIQNMS